MARAMSTSEASTLTDRQDEPGPAEALPDGGTGSLLRAVALQRPVSELTELVTILNGGGQSDYAQEILNTAATLRTVEDITAMLPLLGDPQATTALNAAVANRPPEELAQLVAALDRSEQPAHARHVLSAAATLRTVEDIATIVPLLADPQSVTTLHAAAAQRPVEELAQLVGYLSATPDPDPEPARWKRRR